ncbi:MAG: hypothetical protein FWH07_04550, partial [Oscillospiraceae bacterium]|nr:hypothetical protein [Oscillospiraceae bacterium]
MGKIAMGMRITNSQVHRRYLGGLHQNFKRYNDSQNKIISQRKFTRASQNPLDAAKALKNRKAMREVETYQKNLETAAGIYASAEEAVRGVSGIMQTLQEKLIAGAHGTFNVETDKQIIAREIEDLADQMVRLMNLVIADRRIFGGVNNSSQPYKIEGDVVLYNGVPVNQHSDYTLFPDSRTSYLDAGLGMTFLDEYTIDTQSAIPVTFNGAQILGSGMAERDPTSVTVSAYNFTPVAGENYSFQVNVGGVSGTVLFNNPATGSPTITIPDNLRPYIAVSEDGMISALSSSLSLNVTANAGAGLTQPALTQTVVTRELPGGGFPNNIIQLTLDAAKSVKAGTDDLTALYADI